MTMVKERSLQKELSKSEKDLAEKISQIPNIRLDLDAPLRCGLSRREIVEMKALGAKKPQSVPWGDWNGPKKLSHRMMLICYLAASGMRAREISQQTGMNEGRLSQLLNSEALRAKIELIREVQFKGAAIESQIDDMSQIAIRTQRELLTSNTTNDNLKNKISDKILDRKIGKPVHRTQLEGGSVFTEMFRYLRVKEEGSKESEKPIIDVKNEPEEAEEAELVTAENSPSVEKKEPKEDYSEWLTEKGFKSNV